MTVKQMNERIGAMLKDHPEWEDLEVCFWLDEFCKWRGSDPVEDVNIIKYAPEGGTFLGLGLRPWPTDDEFKVIWPEEET